MTEGLARAVTLAVAACLGPAAHMSCWNAADSRSPGPAVEICFSGQCQQTKMISECPIASGAFMDYANGWSVDYLIIGRKEIAPVSLNGRTIAADEFKASSGTSVLKKIII